METNFWSALPKPFTILAPMAEVTDVPFRRIVAECGRPDVWYTEFVSAAGLCSRGREKLIKDLSIEDGNHPIVAQFFGSNPEHFYESATLARQLGFDGVDINMGCPDRKVVKQGAGIALCKTPELALEIIAAAKEGAGDLPVSVKTRLGYSTIDLGWIERLMEAKPALLTVHFRTMKEMSKVPAHWELAAEIGALGKKHGVLVAGNGDVLSLQDAIEKANEYALDGIMVGRGIFQNPWFFNASVKQVSIGPKERIELLLRHTRYFDSFWGTGKSFNVLKRFYKIYISGWDGAKDLRTKLMETKTVEEVENLIKEL